MKKALMTKENWSLLNACRADKSECREALKNINITDQHVEATNGRIAVRFKIEALSLPNMETGVYKVISAAKYDKMFFELILEHDPEAQFPDTKKVLFLVALKTKLRSTQLSSYRKSCRLLEYIKGSLRPDKALNLSKCLMVKLKSK